MANIDIKNRQEFDLFLRDLQAQPAVTDYSSKLSIKPPLNGKIEINSGGKTYSLWLERGPNGEFNKPVLLSSEDLERTRESEALNSVSYPIRDNINPITGKKVETGGAYSANPVLRDEKGNRPVDATGKPIEFREILVGFDPETKMGTVVKSFGQVPTGQRAQKWVVPADTDVGQPMSPSVSYHPQRRGYTFTKDYNSNILNEPGVATLQQQADNLDRTATSAPVQTVTVPANVLNEMLNSGGLSIRKNVVVKPYIPPQNPAGIRDEPPQELAASAPPQQTVVEQSPPPAAPVTAVVPPSKSIVPPPAPEPVRNLYPPVQVAEEKKSSPPAQVNSEAVAPKQRAERTPRPLTKGELDMFMARPDNKAQTAINAYIFMGIVKDDPKALSAEDAGKIIASYPEDSTIGKVVREGYEKMSAEPNAEARSKIYNGLIGKLITGSLAPEKAPGPQAGYDPEQATHYFAAAQSKPPGEYADTFTKAASDQPAGQDNAPAVLGSAIDPVNNDAQRFRV
jgi:hypothetical protein